MQMATTLRRSTHTFLTHLFGPGLKDDRYVIERFQSCAFRGIRPPIPTTSGHLNRSIRPPVARCVEA